MGAANPVEAARKIAAIARALNIAIKVAAITGDDVLEIVLLNAASMNDLENNLPLSTYNIVSANAYIGADMIVEALRQNADVIVTGRVADPSLFLAPMIYEFGWDKNDFDLLGKGTVTGHLLECAGQVTMVILQMA